MTMNIQGRQITFIFKRRKLHWISMTDSLSVTENSFLLSQTRPVYHKQEEKCLGQDQYVSDKRRIISDKRRNVSNKTINSQTRKMSQTRQYVSDKRNVSDKTGMSQARPVCLRQNQYVSDKRNVSDKTRMPQTRLVCLRQDWYVSDKRRKAVCCRQLMSSIFTLKNSDRQVWANSENRIWLLIRISLPLI